MALCRRADRHTCQRMIQLRQLPVTVRDELRLFTQHPAQRLHPLLREPGQLCEAACTDRIQNAENGVAHPDVSFDGTLGIRLREPFVDGVHLPGHSFADGVDISRCAAYVHRGQLADPRLAAKPAGEKLQRFEHGCRCWHEDVVHPFGRVVEPLCLNDAAQKNFADRGLRLLRFEQAKLRHDIFTYPHAASGEDPLALPRSRAVARDDDRKIRPHGGQHVCIMQNAGRVSAVRPADEQKDIRLFPPDLVDIILRQLKRKLSDQLCSGAEAGHARGLQRQLRHKARYDHPQSACRG